MVQRSVLAAAAGGVAVSVPFEGRASGAAPSVPVAPASEEVTVVEETCREPDERRLLDEPAEELGECWEPREAERGATALLGGLPPAERGLPEGRLSATDMRAAIGLWPDAEEACCGWVAPEVALASGGELVLLFNGDPVFVPFAVAFATETTAVYPLGLNEAAASNKPVRSFSCLKLRSAVTLNVCARETAGSDSPRVKGGRTVTAALCSSTDIMRFEPPFTSPFV